MSNLLKKEFPVYTMTMINARSLDLEEYLSIAMCPYCSTNYRVRIEGTKYVCPCQIIYLKDSKGKKDE